MQITVEIPDEIAKRLNHAWGGLSRRQALPEVFSLEMIGNYLLDISKTIQFLSNKDKIYV
ncbi:hypothetical protein [Scytonema sp. UIC 10036]|uniref:hypothetical protein n=1 Tax=Scytonema sp. UIC 10036 TaxID=2304196 RepID=UPI001A9AF8C3|nr:hypothetical protein [Scytonema sp. UIC 10036]